MSATGHRRLIDRALREEANWTEIGDSLSRFAHETDVQDSILEDLIGAQTTKSDAVIALPLIFQYTRTTRRTLYRKGESVYDYVGQSQSEWIEIDPHTTLKKAQEVYGPENILAYEKVVQHSLLEVTVLPFWAKQSQSLKILVRRGAGDKAQ